MSDPWDPALWSSLVTVVGIWLLTVLTPEPNFLATVHGALAGSRRSGLLVSLGIMLGTSIWASGSLLGLGLLFRTVGWLYLAVKFTGAAYLVFLGIQMILSARTARRVKDTAEVRMTGLGAFRRGLLTDLSNPKAAAFFTSLFAVAVPPDAPLWFDFLVIGLVVIVAGGWYALVAWTVVRDPFAGFYHRASRAISAVAGAVFVALGLRLASER